MKHLVKQLSWLFILVSALTACGGSDDKGTEEENSALLQFYNGSVNSSSISLRDSEDQGFGTATYGDVTQVVNKTADDLEVQLYRTDSDGEDVIIEDLTINLSADKKTLLVLSGDFSDPSVNEYAFDIKELDQHFRLFATAVVPSELSYDLYMAESGTNFENAELLDTVYYGALNELNYWAGDDESEYFDVGQYVFFITEPGGDQILFESSDIDFQSATEFVISIRESNGIIPNQLNLDIISNSTSVSKYTHVNAHSQYRVYNSLDGQDDMEISLMGDSSGNVSNEFDLTANTISEFTEIEFGDYRVSAKSKENEALTFNNNLVTLNKGESKAVVIYQDEENKLSSLEFVESDVSQAFNKQINVINLQHVLENVSLHFVKSDETLDTSTFKITSLEFATPREITLISDYYELIAVHTEDNGSKTLLDRTPLLGINEDKHYIITIEKDLTAASGYKINLL